MSWCLKLLGRKVKEKTVQEHLRNSESAISFNAEIIN